MANGKMIWVDVVVPVRLTVVKGSVATVKAGAAGRARVLVENDLREKDFTILYGDGIEIRVHVGKLWTGGA